ncbi:AIPR family protein [Opitutus sp. ER46]|uniref:AIPR family protein n=1 Tax=Opitutus sp. ER46 TaxID=2161864 RepID=UPI000D300BE0|nr:AIPR family protein [Opitutus sp. ER46]PTX92316.1 abortive phage infection protein [Opitutus sp. ER46]
MTIEEFAEEIRQEVLSRCTDADTGHFKEDKFTEVLIEYLVQANEVDDSEVCYYKHNNRGEKINAFNLSADGECLDLFVTCHTGAVPPESVPNSEVNNHFRWLHRFFEAALQGLHKKLEESSAIFALAKEIYELRDDLSKARFFLLTDGVVRNPEVEDVTVDGVEVSHYIWDLEKLRRFFTSKMQREVITIDFESSFGGSVPCISTSDSTGEYRTFLAYFPGLLLAKLYGEYGPRLLEKNVRSFLQAKGKINKGIRSTIQSEPHRFLAYNNGISATAENVDVEERGAGFAALKLARDFQIVNGGQTTASIYHAFKRDKADLTSLVVQVKLTVLNDPKKIDVFVPLISQYANSQNKVNAADFSANQPYHVKLEELSRRLWAPAASGTERQTRWYYERARGSYLDDKMREGTPARMRAFDALSPIRQKFTKTDLAKYENTWNQLPHHVCLGAEKNFIKFTEANLERGHPTVDEDYFHRLVAKAILFKSAEKLVGAQNYGGFRANIVTYTLAWLSHHSAQRIDLDRIWREQKLSDALAAAIVKVSAFANEHIINPPPNRRNPGEWSKRQECWDSFREGAIDLATDFEIELVDLTMAGKEPGVPQKDLTNVNGAAPSEDVVRLMKIDSDTWFQLAHWAKETDNLSPWQRGLAFSLGKLAANKKAPSEKQAVQGLKILEEAARRGFKTVVET